MNTEDKKQLADTFAKNYKNSSDMYHNNYENFIAGFETGTPKWMGVEEDLPEDDRNVLIKVKDYRRPDENITEVSTGYYDGEWKYSATDSLVDSGHGWFIEKWMEFPQ